VFHAASAFIAMELPQSVSLKINMAISVAMTMTVNVYLFCELTYH
jgi:hypothetical protein